MRDNGHNFLLEGWEDPDFDLSIDRSNTVDGKPLYYIKRAMNIIYGSSDSLGALYCIWCDNITVKDLFLTKNGDAVFFWKTNNSTIENVTTELNSDGINLWYSNNNLLTNNNAISNHDGIALYHSRNNNLTNNNINSNGRNGFSIEDSDYTVLTNNTIISNGYNGIDLTFSDFNILKNNSIVLNSYSGIQFYSSSNAMIYNNYFKNTKNPSFIGINKNNKWNATKTKEMNIIGGPYFGGNYWATPGGSGFSQTCQDIDRDGICDSSYILDTNNIDYLPLSNHYAIQPSVVIYTNNASYRAGDRMYVGLNVTNQENATRVGVYIWVDLPDGGKKDVKSYPSITMPEGLDWKKYPWMTVTLSSNPPGDYAWHAILRNVSTGNIVSESISPWTFGSAVSMNPGSFEAMNGAIQSASVEADFSKEFE